MALALLGIIAVTFLAAINVASRAILIADERTTAESLAKSQMEAIKEQDYIEDVIVGDEVYAIYSPIDTSEEHPSFNIGSIIEVAGEQVAVGDIIGIPWNSGPLVLEPGAGTPASIDEGLQRVKLIVCNNGEDVEVSLEDYVIILEDYKVDR